MAGESTVNKREAISDLGLGRRLEELMPQVEPHLPSGYNWGDLEHGFDCPMTITYPDGRRVEHTPDTGITETGPGPVARLGREIRGRVKDLLRGRRPGGGKGQDDTQGRGSPPTP